MVCIVIWKSRSDPGSADPIAEAITYQSFHFVIILAIFSNPSP